MRARLWRDFLINSDFVHVCSAGTETEKQIKQCIGKELAQSLKVRAQETAASVATASMQPCLVCIDK
jgi:hypothetical protein